MKKCYSLLRWPINTGCAQQTFTVQNKPAAVAPKETITHHFFVSGIGQKKTVVWPKFGGMRILFQTKPYCSSWIAPFYYFEHLYHWKRQCPYCLTIIYGYLI